MLDILIRGGHVLDAFNDIDGMLDVAIDDGVIAEVAASIDPARAETVIDAAGLYVTPGLVELHAHVFFGTESNAYRSNGYGLTARRLTFCEGFVCMCTLLIEKVTIAFRGARTEAADTDVQNALAA